MLHIRDAVTHDFYSGKLDNMIDVNTLADGEEGTKVGKVFYGTVVSKIIDEYGTRDNFWQPVKDESYGLTVARPGEHRKVYVFEDGKAEIPSGSDKDTQIAQLRAQLAERTQNDQNAAKDAYIAQLQSQLRTDTPNTDAEAAKAGA